MAIKPGARDLKIAEQIIEDPVTGICFQFIVVDSTNAPYRLRIFGITPGNTREMLFDANGHEAGAGTDFTGTRRPTWIKEAP